jgi:hypothetical protein
MAKSTSRALSATLSSCTARSGRGRGRSPTGTAPAGGRRAQRGELLGRVHLQDGRHFSAASPPGR